MREARTLRFSPDWLAVSEPQASAQGPSRPRHTPCVLEATHYARELGSPEGWVMYVSHSEEPVTTLVVFVHGWRGRPVESWQEFPAGALTRDWWRHADLLFVGHRSTTETIKGIADRIRREIGNFYPVPNDAALTAGATRDFRGFQARPNSELPYTRLILVGHSMGGVVLRQALSDATRVARDEGSVSPLLSGRLRLFSPAIGGVRLAGMLGRVPLLIRHLLAGSSSGYWDLQVESQTLAELRRWTEELHDGHENENLAADIVWANPEDVVVPTEYRCDPVSDSWDGTHHRSVCKPVRGTFERPWEFVESGIRR